MHRASYTCGPLPLTTEITGPQMAIADPKTISSCSGRVRPLILGTALGYDHEFTRLPLNIYQ